MRMLARGDANNRRARCVTIVLGLAVLVPNRLRRQGITRVGPVSEHGGQHLVRVVTAILVSFSQTAIAVITSEAKYGSRSISSR